MDQQSDAERRDVIAHRQHIVVVGRLRFFGLNIRTTPVAVGSFRR